ncbi:myoneurin-like [Pararge aegeria]|uniref:Jg13778 protein n=2 Tax=Pararge aegeria TaxID=116150 RepID=A0A8S4SAE0_9NEOP|nr:myoneurin-like [Pararge aegeria]CAH2251790.1 jg13778 [Pararge aegeria aegeria]
MFSQEEFEGEIEFLDEDADIVQQCVLNVDNDAKIKGAERPRAVYEPRSLRAEEKQGRPKTKRKRPTPKSDDSDYDPSKEAKYAPIRSRKRRSNVTPTEMRVQRVEFVAMPEYKKKDSFNSKMDLTERRKLQLRVPDYDDPLCLPVRSLKKDNQEQRKLRNWNNLCLEHFKSYDTLLRVDKQPTVASKRIVVLNNIQNRINGRIETTMSAKLSVENKNGGKRTEVIQSVLPKYREKKLLNIRLKEQKKRKPFYIKDEVILTKEVHKEEESLVVYKPMESLSLVYKMFKNKDDDWQSENEDDPDRRHLKEVASCKMCAPCYQTSWRGYKNTNNKKIPCMICERPCISMYNMLAHMKSHPNAAVRACKEQISKCLATALEYHYKCRICDEKFRSIKTLRSHVKNHKSGEKFKCEVCNQNIMSL